MESLRVEKKDGKSGGYIKLWILEYCILTMMWNRLYACNTTALEVLQ